ncbi:hypothetical protein JOQ06_021418 [Pogonophryne albipinna]|uniref:Uncharacterized protein n=1 Tax=Pogonophryne albipinna TaxID=1090488 RepID=A0AAD6ADY6_9TELE|nr:hypothetical protein JOQ06_021418 [Pogonophryne albipinna]
MKQDCKNVQLNRPHAALWRQIYVCWPRPFRAAAGHALLELLLATSLLELLLATPFRATGHALLELLLATSLLELLLATPF